jgi:hypothetical protein
MSGDLKSILRLCMRYLVGFGKFWYDFVIGDDWMIAAAIAVTLLVLALLGKSTLWWLLPLVVILALGVSLVRGTRRSQE